MRLQVRILGRELLAVEHNQQQVAAPAPEPQAEQQTAPPAQPEIPAGFGFHGGAGGSQEHCWQPDIVRPVDAR